MSDVKWIKITVDIFDDEKIQLIECLPEADSILVIWFKLLCLAGKTNNSGVFLLNDRIPYTDKMLATIFRRKESVVDLALKTFADFGMVEIIDNVITIPNWGKHQNLDQLEQKKEYMRNYMRDYRDKQKQIACKTNGKTNSKTNVSRTDKDIDKELEKEKSSNRFTPPTLDEVATYCTERNNKVDPQRFIDYYSSQNWKKSNGQKVADWKACVRTWEQREKKDKKTAFNSFEQRTYDYADLTERLMAKG